MMNDKIDFVITWVNDTDPEWQKEFEYYSAKAGKTVDKNKVRYRSWDTLHYLFRGVEKYTPWVNNVYLVTNANPPKWLNLNHPKLKVVNDKDIVPAQYYPVFSCFPVEFNFHRIEGLSDKFVYFCDDMFILDNTPSTVFFKKGLPCDMVRLSAAAHSTSTIYDNSCFMARAMVNKHFKKKEVIRKNILKWYPLKYPNLMIANALYFWLDKFPGFVMNHLPQIYLKKTYDEIWKYCEEDLDRTCSSKFRSYGDVCPTLLRYWQLASGNFTLCNVDIHGKFFDISDNNIQEISDFIRHRRKKIVCLNDNYNITNFEENKRIIIEALEEILPDKCSFEK